MNSGKQGYIRWGTEQGKHFEIATFFNFEQGSSRAENSNEYKSQQI